MMHCQPKQVLHGLFGTNQRNGSQMIFAAVATTNQPQTFENVTMTGWLYADSNLKASIAQW